MENDLRKIYNKVERIEKSLIKKPDNNTTDELLRAILKEFKNFNDKLKRIESKVKKLDRLK